MPLTQQDIQKLNALQDPTPSRTVTTAEPIVQDAPTQTGSLSANDVQKLKQLNTQDFKVSATGNSVEPVEGLQASIQRLGTHYQTGVSGVMDSVDGAAVGLGLMTEDEFKQKALQSGLQTTSQEDDINTTGFAKFVDVFGGTVAQAIPSLGLTLGGAAIGTVAAPGVGSVGGAALVMGTLAFGHAKADGIRRGEDPLNSEASGIASGIINGALATVGVGFTGKVAKDISAEVLSSQPFKDAMYQSGIKLTQSMGLNLSSAGVASITDSLAKYVATRASSVAKPFTVEEGVKDFGDALKAGAILTGTIGVATAGVGLGLAKNASLEARAQYLSEYLKQETAKIHAENEAALMAKHFPEVEKKESKAAPLQGRVEKDAEVESLKKQLAAAEQKIKDHIAENLENVKAKGEAVKLQQQLNAVLKEIRDLEEKLATKDVYSVEVQDHGHLSAVDNTNVLKAQLEKAEKRRDDLTEEFKRVNSVRDKAAKTSSNIYLERDALKSKLKEAEAKAAEAQKAADKLYKETVEYNKKVQAEEDAKALEEAEKQNEKYQDELYRKNLIDEAVLAVSVDKGAGKAIVNARKEVPVGPLSPAQEAALRAKVFISRDPNEVFNLVTELTESLAHKLPNSRVSGWSGMDLLNHLYTIFQYMSPDNMYKLAAKFDATTAVDARDIIQTKLTNKLYGHVQAATGLDRKGVERLAIKAQKTKVTVTATGADGVEHTITLTIGKVQAFLALMKNKKAQAALTDNKEGNNFTLEATHGDTSTQAVFEAALKAAGPNFYKMLKGIADFYDEIGPDLKKFHDKRNPDNPLNLEKNYGQQVHREGANEPSKTSLTPEVPGWDLIPGESKGTGKGNSAPPGIVKPREALKGRIIAHDAFSSAQNHARKVANYFAFSDPSKLWVDLLGSKDFRHFVSSHFGDSTLKGLETDYEHVVHGSPQALTEVGPIINFLLNAKAVQVLVGNALYAPKHALTVANGLLYKYEGESLPPLTLMQAALDLTLHPNKAKTILGREEVNIRYTRKDYLATAAGSGKMTKAIGATIIPGDKVAVATIIHAIENFVYEQTGDRELAQAEAAKGVEQVLASNSTAKSTPMTRGLVERYVTQFSGPESVVARNVRTAWRIAANHPTHENLVNAIYTDFIGRSALVLFTIPSLVYVAALANLGPHKQNDEKVKNALWHIANTYMVGSQFPLPSLVVPALFTLAVDRVFHENFYIPEKNVPGLENIASLKSASSEAANMVRGKTHKTMHNVLQMMINAIQGTSLPIPLSQVRGAKDLLPKK